MSRSCDWGAQPCGDGTWSFNIWAPAAGSVQLLLDGDAHPMTGGKDGFWRARLPARAGQDYLFRIDGHERPDPASRAQRGGGRGRLGHRRPRRLRLGRALAGPRARGGSNLRIAHWHLHRGGHLCRRHRAPARACRARYHRGRDHARGPVRRASRLGL
ncbi:hypothetical protein [Salipiger bermudensis]|uniref:hypothetical protein n=1 Tax=Salipiger bermudensis TaxID=344736 RepID=UPI000A06EF32